MRVGLTAVWSVRALANARLSLKSINCVQQICWAASCCGHVRRGECFWGPSAGTYEHHASRKDYSRLHPPDPHHHHVYTIINATGIRASFSICQSPGDACSTNFWPRTTRTLDLLIEAPYQGIPRLAARSLVWESLVSAVTSHRGSSERATWVRAAITPAMAAAPTVKAGPAAEREPATSLQALALSSSLWHMTIAHIQQASSRTRALCGCSSIRVAFPSPGPAPAPVQTWGYTITQVSALLSPPVFRLLSSGGAARPMSAAASSITQELRGCTSVRQIKDVVSRHKSRMRPMQHAETVLRLGFLTYGSRSVEREAARRLAAECTEAALVSGGGGSSSSYSSARLAVGLDVLVVFVRGWSWVRRPPRELLARVLEALVPGASEGASGEQHHQLHTGTPVVHQMYGRLHMATLYDAATLVEPLAALEALTPLLLEVLVNVAVRRSGNEDPVTVAAAAVAYSRAGVTDPRVARALLEATTVRRRHGGGGIINTASAVGPIAEALNLCLKAGWYDPRVFAEAADALVARGVGGLTLRQTWTVLKAFAKAQHDHPLLKDALAAHAKALLVESGEGRERKTWIGYVGADQRRGDLGNAAGVGAGNSDDDSCVYDMYDTYGISAAPRRLPSPERQLTRELSTLAGLVHGFSTMHVYDMELYKCLAEGAAVLLHRAPVVQLGESQPRALASAMIALLSGFAAVGLYPKKLLQVMEAQQHSWTRSISVEQALSLIRALAELRYRDERLLDRLDAAAAVFLENGISAAATAAGLLAPSLSGNSATAAAASGGTGTASAKAKATATTAAAVATATIPHLSWLPAFLNAACWRLSYPCPRTAATLAVAAAAWELDDRGNSVLRGLSNGRRKERERLLTTVDSSASHGRDPDTISRLQLLLLVVMEQGPAMATAAAISGNGGGGDGGGDAASPLKPQWVCELLGGLACSGARLVEEEKQDLAWLLARSIEHVEGGVLPGADSRADGRELVAMQIEGEGTPGMAGLQRREQRRRLTAARAAAALDDTAACHLFRAAIASEYLQTKCDGEWMDRENGSAVRGDENGLGYKRVVAAAAGGVGRHGGQAPGGGAVEAQRGFEAALHRAMTPSVAAAILGRASSAWHASGLGTAAPQRARDNAELTAGAAAAPPLSPLKRLRRAVDASHSPLLSDLLRSLGLPVFEQWETSDGFFRVGRGVVLPGGRHVGVEVLPDTAFAVRASSLRTASAATAAVGAGGDSSVEVRSGSSGVGGGQGASSYPVLIGDAAFRARCLAARGWKLVALPAGEWAAAEMAGPAACMMLMQKHSGAL